jgi:hypothetical protein
MLFCPQQNGSFRPRASFVVGRNPHKKTEKMDAIYRHKAESSCKKFYKSGKGKHRKLVRDAEARQTPFVAVQNRGKLKGQCQEKVWLKSILGQRVKAFLLRWNVDLKNRSFKTVDRKIFKQVSGSYLRSKAFPNMLF